MYRQSLSTCGKLYYTHPDAATLSHFDAVRQVACACLRETRERVHTTMPTDLDEYDAGGVNVLFAADLEGHQFRLTELAVYEAEEVREETQTDVPKFGNWMRAEDDEGPCWIVALGELVEELQAYEDPSHVTFECTKVQKRGDKQTDPYTVNLHPIDGDTSQQSL